MLQEPLVTGGEFARNYDAMNGGMVVYPAKVSDFRLDKFEVTVGRFRQFVAAWVGGWRPNGGDGKHSHLHSGQGLTSTLGGYEPGWDATWSAGLPSSKGEWDRNLACNDSYPAWSSEPGDRELLPINCATWYEEYAFCIWDSGFLPSVTERNYAGSGGDEQRTLPWSIPPASTISDGTYAVYCGGSDCGLLPVGSKSPKGNGRYGQADLAGNVSEATLDEGDRYSSPCDDCIQLDNTATARLSSGNDFLATQWMQLYSWIDTDIPAEHRDYYFGVRCARDPASVSSTDPDLDGGTRTDSGTGPAGHSDASCDGLQKTCGPHADEDCCASTLVQGGPFNRNNDPSYPATISDFRLDRFEITVGRFRKFVSAWNAGFRPAEGAGKHAYLNGGKGLAAAAGGYETGWDARWTDNVPLTPEEWNQVLASCGTSYEEWTPAPDSNETRPITCVTLYEVDAFCIWDGGFLPSDAEWSYAAVGGSEQRSYPWGSAAPDDSYAVFGPSGIVSLAVGSKSPKGDGRYGQADLRRQHQRPRARLLERNA